jgi:hypothetical protein
LLHHATRGSAYIRAIVDARSALLRVDELFRIVFLVTGHHRNRADRDDDSQTRLG